MEVVRDLARPKHRDRIGQQRIDAAHPRGRRTRRIGIEVNHLQAGMHTAVGPSGRRHAHRCAGDGAERRLERILYRAAAGLRLPAEEATAVVLDA